MARMLKIRCNGANHHPNEVDLDKLLRPTVVVRGERRQKPKEMPERLVVPCHFCTDGRVIITREMMAGEK